MRRTALLLLLPLSGCARDAKECPVPQLARGLVQDVAAKALVDVMHVARFSTQDERGYAFQLPGVDQAAIGFVFLAPEARCEGPVVFDTYCEGSFDPEGEPVEAFWATRDRCVRLRCESAGVGLVDVYFTMKPRTDPDDRHPFTYDATNPAGAVTYDPNPLVTYRVDLRTPGVADVSADVRQGVSFAPPNQPPIDLSHTGLVTATRDADGEVRTASLALLFTGFSEPVTPVVVQAELDAQGHALGEVNFGATRLASISGGPPVLAWEGICATP